MEQEKELLDELQRFESAGDIIGALNHVASRGLSLKDLTQLSFKANDRNINGVCWGLFSKLKPHLGLDDLTALSLMIPCRISGGLNADAHFQQLRQAISQIPPEGSKVFLRRAEKRFANTAVHAVWKEQWDVLANIRSMVTALDPELNEIFSKEKSEFFQTEPEDSTDLPAFHPPPPPQERSHRKAVVAMRKKMFESAEKSRLFDAGHRICAAMRVYGWEAELYEIDTLKDGHSPEKVLSDIAALCGKTDADLLVLDQIYVGSPEEISSFLEAKPDVFPDARLVMTYFDPWIRDTWEQIESAAGYAHAIWSPWPSMPLWKKPAFNGKMCYAPIPSAWARQAPLEKLSGEITFYGGIQIFNWYRAIWMEAIREEGIPMKKRMSSHFEYKPDALADYHGYMERLSHAGACVNFSLRLGGSRTSTGRTHEVLCAGGLLIEEENEDTNYYLTPWRHYIPFRTLGDLCEVSRLLKEEPERCEAIMEEGHKLARERYNDETIIGELDLTLYS